MHTRVCSRFILVIGTKKVKVWHQNSMETVKPGNETLWVVGGRPIVKGTPQFWWLQDSSQ